MLVLPAPRAHTRTSPSSAWRIPLRVVAYVALWTAIGALFSVQSFLTYSYGGTRTVSGLRLLAFSLADWYVWAALAPAILWLARRFNFARTPWRSAMVHIPASLLFVIARSGLRLLVGLAIPSVRIGPPALLTTIGLQVFVYWAILGVGIALEHYHMYRREQTAAAALKTQLARAELGLLKMQLQPHFLFNALNAISEQVHADPEAAERMITQLSDLLRHTIRSGDAHEISLREEISLLERYLGIQHARFAGRLRTLLDVDPSVMEALVPNLVLQPLVENAIQHGIAPRASGGQVTVIARRDTTGKRLKLDVRDDGIGLLAARERRTAAAHASGQEQEGVGIQNTIARLRQLYGDDYGFALRDAANGGAVAAIWLPLRFSTINAQASAPATSLSDSAAESLHGA